MQLRPLRNHALQASCGERILLPRMARQRLRFLAGIPRTQPRQTLRRPTPGRRGADGRGLRRELQKPAGRRLSARVPHKNRLLRPQPRLPPRPQGDAGHDARSPAPAIPRAHGPHVRRYGSAAGKTTGRRSGSGLDRAAIPAAHAPIRFLCPAGRVGTYPAVRPVRCPVRRSPLRPLPELPGQLSDGSHRRAQGDRHEPLHLLSYDRKGVRQRPARPRRMDLRLRSLPRAAVPTTKKPPCTARRISIPCSTR